MLPSPRPPHGRSRVLRPARVRPPAPPWPGSRAVTSSALEEAFAFVAGDHLVEERLLGARVVQIVVDDVGTKGGASDRSVLERADRLVQGVWKALDVGFVRVAGEHRRRF